MMNKQDDLVCLQYEHISEQQLKVYWANKFITSL